MAFCCIMVTSFTRFHWCIFSSSQVLKLTRWRRWNTDNKWFDESVRLLRDLARITVAAANQPSACTLLVGKVRRDDRYYNVITITNIIKHFEFDPWSWQQWQKRRFITGISRRGLQLIRHSDTPSYLVFYSLNILQIWRQSRTEKCDWKAFSLSIASFGWARVCAAFIRWTLLLVLVLGSLDWIVVPK